MTLSCYITKDIYYPLKIILIVSCQTVLKKIQFNALIQVFSKQILLVSFLVGTEHVYYCSLHAISLGL